MKFGPIRNIINNNNKPKEHDSQDRKKLTYSNRLNLQQTARIDRKKELTNNSTVIKHKQINKEAMSSSQKQREQIVNKTKIDRFRVSEVDREGLQGNYMMNLAPSNQYAKYLDQNANVFYEDSANVKNMKRIKICKVYLLAVLLILILMYVIIGRIVPFPKNKCPRNADCQVFIKCHKGYVREDEKCLIDPEIVNQAKQITTAVVEQLSLDYGNRECNVQLNLINETISKKIREVFEQFEIKDYLLQQQIANLFQNKQFQAEKQFSYRINTIVPNSKKYSLSCQLQIFYNTPTFKYLLLLLLLLLISSIYLIRWMLLDAKASKIYQVLKQKTTQQESIVVDQFKKDIQQCLGNWDDNLWVLIDRKRYEDGKIVYYIEHQQLNWKLFQK